MTFSLPEARAILQRTPATLEALLRGLPEPWLVAREGPDTWSPLDVVGHLADLEEQDWIVRARIVLDHGEARPFDPVERERFRETMRGRSLEETLERFAARRSRNLQALDALALTPDQLELGGTHPALGRVTLRQLLATWAVHDLAHIGQIARVMAKRYTTEVGPWRAYLPILDR